GTDVFATGGVAVDALGDVGALGVERDHDGAGVAADAHLVVGVADFVDHVANNLLVIHDRLSRDFSGDDRQPGGHHRFAGDAAVGVLGEQCIQDAVGNPVRQLVRVAHADRFASE